MLTPGMMKVICKARFKYDFEMRAIAAYYASKPNVHPNPSETKTLFVTRTSGPYQGQVYQYVRVAADNHTLAVFRITRKCGLKRLKRWPRSIDDGTAVTRVILESWYSDYDDELDDLLDELDAPMAPSENSGKAIRHGFAQ